MPVIPGNVIKLQNIEKGVTRIIPPPPEPSSWGNILRILGTIASVALVPLAGPETLLGTLALETASIGFDIGLQAAASKIEGTKLDALSIGFSLLGGAGAALSTVKAARTLERAAATAEEIGQKAIQEGFNSLQTNVIATNAQKVITEKLSAEVVSEQLIRAGLTEEQTLKQLEAISQISKEHGLNLGRFNDELAFINQETEIFQKLNEVSGKFGFSLNEVFSTLSASGIDVIGVQTTDQLAKVIKGTEQAAEALKGSKLLTKLEGALERDLEPTLFTRVLNAKNAEKAAVKVNKLLSLANPNTLITEITNKIFDPLKSKLAKRVIEPLKKKTEQKMKHLLRQDLVRKQETRNGVYPCFGSSWINYIRAIPVAKGEYKAGVVFRKWGYKQVIVTPVLSLQFIIGWSESSSPGRIYHDFRKKYGGPKGDFTPPGGDAGFKANTAEIFNLLGFIPDRYISLGISLIANIATTRSVISTNAWTDFFESPGKMIKRPLEDKGLEMLGGQAAKAVRDQAAGNRGAVQAYFEGKVKENTERRESAFRQASRGGKGKLDSVKSIGGIIK